jgi:protein TonB
MNRQAKSLLISSAINLGVVCLVLIISNSFTHQNKTVVIDFTLLDSKGSKSAGNSKDTGQSPRAPVKPGYPVNRPKALVTSQPQIAKVVPAPSKPVPSPLTEPARIAPAAVPVPASAPTPATTSSGNTMGKSGSEAGSSGSGSGHAGGSSGSGSGHGQAGSGNGTGNSTEQLRKRYLAEQFEYIRKLIEKNIKYPARALRMGWSGRVLVSFTILESGHVANMKILSSSGYDLLDENLLDTIKTVEPFPKPPVSAQLKISFNYKPEQ